jgi:hypothetical protein
MESCQDEIDIKIEEELNNVAKMLWGVIYDDYCKYEDDVAILIKQHCPTCQSVINDTTIGIFPLWGNIRNYIRSKSYIRFK